MAAHPFHQLVSERRRRLLAGAGGRVVEFGAADVDGVYDTVVCCLALCTVDDQAAALAEIRRLLRPDGRLLFLEHVRTPGMRGILQSAATPVWSRIGAGCHLDRDTLNAIRAAGFAITDCERSGALVQGIAQFSKRKAVR